MLSLRVANKNMKFYMVVFSENEIFYRAKYFSKKYLPEDASMIERNLNKYSPSELKCELLYTDIEGKNSEK